MHSLLKRGGIVVERGRRIRRLATAESLQHVLPMCVRDKAKPLQDDDPYDRRDNGANHNAHDKANRRVVTGHTQAGHM